MSAEFLLTSLIVVASPGTGALLTVATGLARGARAAIAAALGCTLGILPHILVAITGLATLLHGSALAFKAIQYAGVTYLLFMAAMTLKEHGTLKIESDDSARSGREVIWRAILVNLLNPKLSIFFLAFLPPFIDLAEPHPTLLMLRLSLVFMAITFVVFALYGAFAASVRDQVLSRPGVLRWMRRVFALAFVALGLKLAFVQI